MNEVILIIILAVVIIGFGVILYIVNQQIKGLKSSGSVEMIKSDVIELSRGINSLQQVIGNKLDNNNNVMQSSMQKQLTESAKLVSDVTQRLAKLDETNRRVVDVADELKTLQNVLQNPKQRGFFGE